MTVPWRVLLLPLVLCAGCGDPRDRDGDGHLSTAHGGDDCRDRDPAFHTGAVSTQQGVSMVAVCAGSFHMGSLPGEEGNDTHKPVGPREVRRRVTLTRDFYIGRFQVTRQQAVTFLGLDTSRPDTCKGRCPVGNITWHEAAALANGASRAAGLTPCYRCQQHGLCDASPAFATPYLCPGFRLPTSAELEYATRAGTTTAFSCGGDLPPGYSYGCQSDVTLTDGTRLVDIAWYCGNSDDSAHEVGKLKPNPWGLYDVHGNVYSWCHDWYVPATKAPQTDPEGADPALHERVTRGGSWFTDQGPLRSAYRSSFPPHKQLNDLGLRLVRSLPPPSPPDATLWALPLALAAALLLGAAGAGIWIVRRRRRSSNRDADST